MPTITKNAADLFGHMIGEHVTVTFSDGGEEAGVLVACGWDVIDVEQCDVAGGGQFWTAQYTLTGDVDTPHVVSVVLDHPQIEALFS